ncbi:MAG: class I SAM-dependent methyltransferase [Bryobacteraceae bacterium]|nr:class I SAM-dependent methyltransferase [Bryobacteraceae bacterium]
MAQALTDAEVKAYLPKLSLPQETTIGPKDGQYLHDLTVKLKAKRVLEIGTAHGYSALWLAMALRKTEGRLVTLEIHEGHHAIAREHFAATGLARLVDARLADALEEIPRLEGPFELVLIDAIKTDYLRYYELVLPKVRKGGVIAAHTVASNPDELREFLARIKADPAVRTEFAHGLSLSYKK